jgi:Zn-dependent peptidase ImmA (M78 family)
VNAASLEAGLSRGREEELAEFAEWIADDLAPGTRSVDPDAIARRKGITVCSNDYGDAFDGLLEYRGGEFLIYRNTARATTAERARFTLAHELGHYFIDAHREALASGRVGPHGSYCDFHSKNIVEREADCFAANLLMPPGRVAREVRGRPDGLATALHLAHSFQTSRTSAALRIVQIDRAPCALVLWRDGRFLWKRISETARRSGMRSALREAQSVPPDSATGRVAAGEADALSAPVVGASTAATWFRGITHGARTNYILREEVLSLGRYGVLTMLILDDV